MIGYLMLIGCVFLQSGSYCLGYRIIFNQHTTANKQKYILFFVLMLLIHSVMCFTKGPKSSYDVSVFTQLMLPLLLIKDKKLVKYYQYVLVVTTTSFLGIVPLYVIAIVKERPVFVFLDSMKWTFVIEIIVLVIMMLIYLIIRKSNEDTDSNIGIECYIAITAVVTSSIVLIGSVQTISTVYKGALLNYIGMGTSISCMVPMIVIIWLIRTERKRSALEYKYRLNEELLILQKKYYESIENNNQEIARFRHDLKGHLQALNECIQEGDLTKGQEYLSRITEEADINNRNVYTGNGIIDAIINPLAQRCKSQRISLNVKGCLPKDITSINIYDLSSIFYNLMNNAVEESERILDNEPWINIEVAIYNGLLRIWIENKSGQVKDFQSQKTEKDDGLNHGYGLKNVERVVEKYNGTLSINSIDGSFNVEILL